MKEKVIGTRELGSFVADLVDTGQATRTHPEQRYVVVLKAKKDRSRKAKLELRLSLRDLFDVHRLTRQLASEMFHQLRWTDPPHQLGWNDDS